MKNLEVIHRLLDNTYNPVSKSGTYSLKHSMHGDTVVLNYKTVVYFASEQSLRPQVEVAREQARQLIKEKIDLLKKDFKDATETAFKFEDKGESDDIELIQSTSNSPRKVAYYRYRQTIKIN